MAYQYGPTPIPLAASVAPPGRDNFTFYCLQYFQTIANTYTVNEWNNIFPHGCGPKLPVSAAIDYDPREYVFNENQLPLLAFYRSKVTSRTQIGQDVRIEAGVMTLLWVPTDAQPETRKLRSQFANKLYETIDMYLERGRDVAYQVPGDTYFSPSLYGSTLAQWAQYWRIWMGANQRIQLRVPGIDATTFRMFEAYEAVVNYELRLLYDLSARFASQTETDITIQAPADPGDSLPDPLILDVLNMT